MDIETAESLHRQLLEGLPGHGDATSALSDVVRLHAPNQRNDDGAACGNCVTFREEYADWPCRTVAVINAYAWVDGIPAGAEAWLAT